MKVIEFQFYGLNTFYAAVLKNMRLLCINNKNTRILIPNKDL